MAKSNIAKGADGVMPKIESGPAIPETAGRAFSVEKPLIEEVHNEPIMSPEKIQKADAAEISSLRNELDELYEGRTGKREAGISEAVGETKEEQEAVLTAIKERFNGQKQVSQEMKELGGITEIEKTPEQIEMIQDILKNMDEFVRRNGGTSVNLSLDNIHFVDKFPELYEKDMKGATYLKIQSILICPTGKPLHDAGNIAHELLHFNSFSSPALKEGDLEIKREGISVHAENGETYFDTINEAVIEELAKKFDQEHFNRIPALAQSMKERRDVRDKYVAGGKSPERAQEIKYITEENGDTLLHPYAYGKERQNLDRLIGAMIESNPELGSKEDVFEMFVRATMNGDNSELQKIYEGIYGEGSFQELGEKTKRTEEVPEPIDLSQDIEPAEPASESEKKKGGILGPIRSFFDWLKDRREQQKRDVENFRAQSDRLFILISKKVEIMADPQLSIGQINEEFGERYGLSFPKEDLPKIFLFEGDRTFFAKDINIITKEGEKKAKDVIGIEDIYKSLDGGTMSEELAHFYRERLKPKEDKTEGMTDEFFGFLGSRLFDKAIEDGSVNLSDIKGEKREPLPKKETLEISKQKRGEIRGFQEINNKVREAFGDEAEGKLETIFERMVKQLNKAERDKLKKAGINSNDDLIKMAQDERNSMLVHQRGYEWASKVDMDKINDWKKLFSMPNAEVRKRFFTDKPDYSGL